MDGKKNVKIISQVDGTVGVRLPNLNFAREWITKGQVVTFPEDILEEAMYDVGFSNMIKSGVLFIDNLDAAKSLGLEDENAKEPTLYKRYTDEDLKNLINKASVEDFKKALETLPEERIRDLKDWSITLRMRNAEKVDLLEKRISGFNMDTAIRLDNEYQRD